MAEKKTLQELTIKDNFMFAAVMIETENARKVLELALGIEIDRIEVTKEKSIIYNPEYKGVRLDLYAKDEKNTRYNVEMQVATTEYKKRSRYYHDHIDMELLEAGTDYEKLPDTYVIFICDNDPFGLGKYRYTVKKAFEQQESFVYDDGCHTVFLSTKGTNDNEESKELINFLHFVGADLEHCMDNYDDAYVKQLQNSVKKVKKNREMMRCYMLFEDIKKEEYNAGKADGLIQSITMILSAKGIDSERILASIESIGDLQVLQTLVVKASQVESAEEFQKEVELVK